MPNDSWWSERLIFGLLIIVGFVMLTGMGMLWPALSADQRQFGRDGLLVLGPIVGMIAAAIWKTDKADKQNAASLAALSGAAADTIARGSPPPPAAPAPVLDPSGLPLAPIPYQDLPAAEAQLNVADPPPKVGLAWGTKVSPAFRTKVRDLCSSLGFDPNWLMACLAFESGRTFSPTIKNPRSSATGISQIVEKTAVWLGTTTALLAKMTAEEQLDVVGKYFRRMIAAHGPITSLADCYMTILNPVAVGKPDNYQMWVEGSSTYAANAGLDANGDHIITKAEAADQVGRLLAEGLRAPNISYP